MSVNWIWSPNYGDYYYPTVDDYGRRSFVWASQQPRQPPPSSEEPVHHSQPAQPHADEENHQTQQYTYEQLGSQQQRINSQPTTGHGAHQEYGGLAQYAHDQSQYSVDPQMADMRSQPMWNQPFETTPASAHYTPSPYAYPGGGAQIDPRYASHHRRQDSGSGHEPDSNAPDQPLGVSATLKVQYPKMILGTPHNGWQEKLDPSYRMRTGREAHQFFIRGRVIAMLWAEAASETSFKPDATVVQYNPNYNPNDSYTVGRFGQTVFSQIRRFVVVQVRKRDHFVYACPITTYKGRATTKPGCNPKEHAIVYFSGSCPQHVRGEQGNGMNKDPIEIVPATPGDTMDNASRIRFGKSYPIEWNVKVKDIGKVNSRDMSKLIKYWKEENYDSGEDEIEPAQ